MDDVACDDNSRCLTVLDEKVAFTIYIDRSPGQRLSSGELDHHVVTHSAAHRPI